MKYQRITQVVLVLFKYLTIFEPSKIKLEFENLQQ